MDNLYHRIQKALGNRQTAEELSSQCMFTMLEKKLVWNTIRGEVTTVVTHTTISALFCTLNALFGFNDTSLLVSLGVMSILTAYIIHKKKLVVESFLGFYSLIAMVRYATLLALALVSTLLATSVTNFPKGFHGLEQLCRNFFGYHAKVTACVAVYRIYLSIFGGLAWRYKKYQEGDNPETPLSSDEEEKKDQ